MRYWQSDNRTSTAVLPHLRATQKGNLARPHSRSPQALLKTKEHAMHCHLHRGDWSFHLTNEKKKLSISSSHSIPTPVQPVPALTYIATGLPIFLCHWHHLTLKNTQGESGNRTQVWRCRGKHLTTRPTRRLTSRGNVS